MVAVPVIAGTILGWLAVRPTYGHGRREPSLSSHVPPHSLTNMWELLALLVSMMEHKGLITREQVIEMIDELQHHQPLPTPPPREPVAEPYLPPESAQALEERILELFRTVHLTPERVKTLLYQPRS